MKIEYVHTMAASLFLSNYKIDGWSLDIFILYINKLANLIFDYL